MHLQVDWVYIFALVLLEQTKGVNILEQPAKKQAAGGFLVKLVN
ncbi:hypothetical protein [Motilimonas cestriensis]|nr:hypothetical protein [Motilimonas cestriensis]